MRKLAIFLLIPLLAGCTDSLGIGSNCSAEMQEVRRQEGRGPDSVQTDELAGNHSEQWVYFGGGSNRVYTFRWGTSYESCQVSGPVRFWQGTPGPPQALSLSLSGNGGRS